MSRRWPVALCLLLAASCRAETRIDTAYFSPPDAQGGWRRLERPDEIRRLAGMDPRKLDALRDWLLQSDRRDFAAVVMQIFSLGWELPARLTGDGGRSGAGLPADARSKPGSGGQIVALVPSLDLVAARQTGASGAWEYEEFLRRVCAAAVDWPPEHLRGLPPDRLARMRDTLAATAGNGLARLDYATAVPGDSIRWLRAGIGALVLGQRADEINRFFESEKFAWPENPKFGFALFSTDGMRLYGLLNRRTGPIPGRLSPAAQDNLERQMWAVAKANSRIDEARRSVRDMEGSENHHLSSKVCDLLAAQFLRKIPAFAGRTYDDGSTPDAQYEARRAYFMDWLDERARRGQFVEAGSPSYQPDTINALFNLRDFAEDPLLRRKTEMFLDLAYANIAEETLLTTRGGPRSRVKTGHEYNEGMCDRGYDLLFDAPGRTFAPMADNYRTTSDYLPPPAVVALARDTGGRGVYAFAKRWPGPLAARRERDTGGWRTLDPEKTVLRYGFATPDYVLGSAAVDPAWPDDMSMGFRWQGAVFAGDTLARIGFEVQPASDRDWHGFNPFFSLQDRNILITQKWAPVPPNPAAANPAHLRVYFSPTLDEVLDEGGWIFARDAGAFAAVKVVAGGYAWKPAWRHADRIANDNKSFVVLDSENSPVILVVNRAADYAGDFAAFRAAVKAEPVRQADGALHFATLSFRGPADQGTIGGRVVNLAPKLGYDSPFIRSEWGSGLIRIRKGAETLVLDFRDPRNPVKTVGAAVTDAFPPGVGNAKPIVLGAKP